MTPKDLVYKIEPLTPSELYEHTKAGHPVYSYDQLIVLAKHVWDLALDTCIERFTKDLQKAYYFEKF